MISVLRTTWYRRPILYYFVNTLLSQNYRNKSFGFLWALFDPLLFMAVYYVVFGCIIARRPPSFMMHIYVGIVAFNFVNACANQCATNLRSQAGLIREIAFPKTVLPLSIVLARLFDFSIGWVAAIPLAIIFHAHLSWHWLLIPVVMVFHMFVVIGISFIVSYIGVFFADIQNVLNVTLRFWFYMSPVLYDMEKVKEFTKSNALLHQLYLANPMAGILECYYALVCPTPPLLPHLPYYGYFVRAAVASVVILLVGMYVFIRSEGQIEKYV